MKDDDKDKNIKSIGSKLDSEKKEMTFEKYSDSKESLYLEKAIEEMDTIKVAFIGFQHKIEDLASVEYLVPAIESFAIFASSLSSLLEPPAEDEEISQADLKKAKEIDKLRANMLQSIKRKYFD